MNTNPQTTTAVQMPLMPVIVRGAAGYTRRGSAMAPMTVNDRRRHIPVSSQEVRELIDAAGPLSLADIAGGLGVPVIVASTTVNAMLCDGSLRQDEWGRHGGRWPDVD